MAKKKIQKVDTKETEVVEKKKKDSKEARKPKIRGKAYLKAKKLVAQESYSVKDAVSLVKKLSTSKFTGKLEAHLVVDKEGDVAKAKIPHFKGKQKKVVVFSDAVAKQIKSGKIDFDVLLASSKDMPKLVPFARVLGPKGLMPNPKNGTLVADPAKAVKNFAEEKLVIKTEKKAPVVHLVLGTLDQKDSELVENIEAVIKVIGEDRIKKLALAPTMGPSVKIKL